MFVKINNGQIEKYPYAMSDLRKDYPNVSFANNISAEDLALYGVYNVVIANDPEYNSRTQRLVTQQPTLINGVWTVTQSVIEKTEDQLVTETNRKSVEVREQRDRLLLETDWRFRSDMNPSQEWIDYCQVLRDIPQQEGFPWDVTFPTKPE